MHRGFWWGNLNEEGHTGDRLRRKDNNKVDFKICGGRTWNGLIWLGSEAGY